MGHLFLQGPIGIGKSHLLRKLLLPHLDLVGGYFVQRIYEKDRDRAFSLIPISDAEGFVPEKSVERMEPDERTFLYSRGGKWHVLKNVFEIQGTAFLQAGVRNGKKLILLDEIGGIELDCPVFMETVLGVLESGVPTLGVLKSEQNRAIQNKVIQNRVVQNRRPALQNANEVDGRSYLEKIRNHPGIRLCNISAENYSKIEKMAEAFIKAAMQ